LTDPGAGSVDPGQLFDALGYWDVLDQRSAEERVDSWRRGEATTPLVPEPPARRPADETQTPAPVRNMYGANFRRRPLKRIH
jgi:hypothetical protein